MKTIIALALLSAASAVHAGTPLWQNIEAGMTLDQVKALYPEAKGTVKYAKDRVILNNAITVGKCQPTIRIFLTPNMTVDRVRIDTENLVRWNKETCANEAYSMLLAKYGEPVTRHDDKTEFLGYEGTQQITHWTKDGVAITYKVEPDLDYRWYLEFASAAPSGTNPF